MPVIKTGDWEALRDTARNIQDSMERVQLICTVTAARTYKSALIKELIHNRVRLTDEFSEYMLANLVETVRMEKNKSFTGIFKGPKTPEGDDVVQLALEAEYGFSETAYMGIWRKTQEETDKVLEEKIRKILKEL